jgi:hypothetical protein
VVEFHHISTIIHIATASSTKKPRGRGSTTRNLGDSRDDNLAHAHASACLLPTLSRLLNTDEEQAQAEVAGLWKRISSHGEVTVWGDVLHRCRAPI